VFTMAHVLKAQEEVLEELDDLCLDQVCPLFQEHSTVSAEIVRAIHDKVDLVVQRNDGNRAQIEAVIRGDLPRILDQHAAAVHGAMEGGLRELTRAVEALSGEVTRVARSTEGEGDLGRRLAQLERTLVHYLAAIALHTGPAEDGHVSMADRLVTAIEELKQIQTTTLDALRASSRKTSGTATKA